jgi:hypothetical protein
LTAIQMAVVFGFGPLHEKQGQALSPVVPIPIGDFGLPASPLHRSGDRDADEQGEGVGR